MLVVTTVHEIDDGGGVKAMGLVRKKMLTTVFKESS